MQNDVITVLILATMIPIKLRTLTLQMNFVFFILQLNLVYS